jgi:nicotinate-nucleotide--dimethylbenzimidazole phosphoribosyltransferase
MNESLPGLEWFRGAIHAVDDAAEQAANERQAVLTKPAGSLGQLESAATRLAGLQGRRDPKIERLHICVFAADHGVAADGVSAYPQAVTAEMVKNFARGGAAISVLARALEAPLEVINLGTVAALDAHPAVRDARIAAGTANMTTAPAMSMAQLLEAMQEGRRAVKRAVAAKADLFIGGEMGIGNTTAAAALACALLDEPASRLAGPGTGVDFAGLARKVDAIERALQLHCAYCYDPLEALRRVGGFEIAALAGAYITCARLGLPALVDGYIASAAALAAGRICNDAGRWLLFAHRSAEPGHARILAAMQAKIE